MLSKVTRPLYTKHTHTHARARQNTHTHGPQNMKSAAQYRRHTPEGHVLERPDMYVGSTERVTAAVPVHDGEAYRAPEERLHSPAFLKTVDEVLTNVLDQHESCKGGVGSLAVTLTDDRITVRNRPATRRWRSTRAAGSPSVVFFQLLLGELRRRAGPRYVGGRNGVGAKATLIFATEAMVEVATEEEEALRQTCGAHDGRGAAHRRGPSDGPSPGDVSWKPDLPRSGTRTGRGHGAGPGGRVAP